MSMASISIIREMPRDGTVRNARDKLLLIVIASRDGSDNATDNGGCTASCATLAAECLMSERSIQRRLVAFRNAGLITITRRGPRPSSIRFVAPKTRQYVADHLDAAESKRPAKNANMIRHSYVADKSPKALRENTGVFSLSSARDHPGKTNLTKREAVKKALEAALSSGQADAVIDHRHAIHSPLTLRAAELLAREFASAPVACGLTADDAADHMIARGWRGFKAAWVANDQRRDTERPNGSGRRHQPEHPVDYFARQAREARAREQQEGGYLDDTPGDDTGQRGFIIPPGQRH